MVNSVWGKIDLKDGEERLFQFGSLSLTVRREGNELRTSRVLAGEERVVGDPRLLADPEGWKRWVFKEEVQSLSLSPKLAQKSFVVSPRDQFHLLRGVTVRVYMGLPLWVCLEGAGGGELTRLPSRFLPRTWFGSNAAGEICYWLRSRYFLSAPPKREGSATVIVPLKITNNSDKDLPVRKINLRMRHFSLFLEAGRYWTDEASIRFDDIDQGCEIQHSEKPPDEISGAKLVDSPDLKPSGSFIARSFFNIFGSASSEWM